VQGYHKRKENKPGVMAYTYNPNYSSRKLEDHSGRPVYVKTKSKKSSGCDSSGKGLAQQV
jgi:hypothetical protein